jgi:DNA-binding transcriptional LysR family regulator
LESWVEDYPDIKIEISTDNRFTDIVANRFDIGVRLGDDIAKDMIAVRIAPDMRMVVVGSPAYFAKASRPNVPHDLLEHNCIGLRLPTYGGLLPWEFMQNGRSVNVNVSGQLTFNESPMLTKAVLAGRGLAWLPDDLVREHIAAGRLESALEDWAAVYPGYHLYYASRNGSQALALVVERLRYTKAESV